MQQRWRGLLALLVAGSSVLAHAGDWRVLLIRWDANPNLDRSRVERAYLGHATGSAEDGLALAFEDGRFELEAARTTIKLEVQTVGSADEARNAAAKAQSAGVHAIVTELPTSWTAASAGAVKLPVVNVDAASDSLRARDCKPNLFHTLPSERMRADALAQAMVARKWSQVLLLTSTEAQDVERVATVTTALRRFGLKTVAQKTYKLSADPRERALANTTLLTTGVAYDAVWVVDGHGEFARQLPYNLALPRPVVGDAGLTALAWHPQFERFGAPQVSRRFQKASKRAMTAQDWAAWMAGKAIGAAAMTITKPDASKLTQALSKLSLDGSKGVAMSFRTWDGQLRQPMLLSDGQGVVGTAPIEGVLHPSNNLDTLGNDAPEKLCGAAR